jgi:hypothetical protein
LCHRHVVRREVLHGRRTVLRRGMLHRILLRRRLLFERRSDVLRFGLLRSRGHLLWVDML